MNKYFVNITVDLDVKRVSKTLSDTSTSVSSKEVFNTPDNFSFHAASEDEVRREILRLDGTTGMLKSTIDIRASILTKIINLS